MDELTRLDATQRLADLIAAARSLGNRSQEALDTLEEGHPHDAYRVIYNASNLEPELAAVRDAFETAGISPSI